MSKRIWTLTYERLREVLDYDPEAGVFTWRAHKSGHSVIGTRAGGVMPSGYRMITVDGFSAPAHRIAWLYMTGEPPAGNLRLINGVRDDARWVNIEMKPPKRVASDVSADRVRERLAYDPSTGRFTWRDGQCQGKSAGTLGENGYTCINLDGRTYKAHRLAWLYVHGEWPERDIDHINCVKSDNRVSNLRPATMALNSQNVIRARVSNRSGLLGAFRETRGPRRYFSKIKAGKVIRYLGSFDTPQEAHAAYVEAKRELHPYGTL